MKPIVLLVFLSVLFSLLTSCTKEDKEEEEREAGPKRTILVYIGRDNNLNGKFENKRDSIIKGWNGKGGHLVIYQDLPEGSTFEVIHKEKGEAIATLVYEKAEDNSASAEVFERVIKETVAECPADSYGLILFSHATGWLPDDSFQALRSIVRDQDAWMNLPDFANAIPDKQFEFIVFEACLMAGIEVAYELKDKSNYILASPAEVLSPGFRDIYPASINKLFLPDADLASFTNDIYEYQKELYFSSVTLSLIRTSALPKLAEWVRKYANPVDYPAIEGIQVFDRKGRHVFFDFEQHFSRLTDNEAARSELAALLEECLVCKYHTPSFLLSNQGFKITHYSGLTTYIAQESFPYLNEAYKDMLWTQAISKK